MQSPIREVVSYKHYFKEFNDRQTSTVQRKIEYVLDLIRYVQRVPEKFLKHVEGSKGIYEIRVEVSSNIYRIFCFFDEGQLVILMNGFQKKSQKTPKNEIELAERLKEEYFVEKLTEL
ncbi:type II toxin-antitoxin system RelE/ParE family toxin [Spirosoma montaniterrae]|uniref:Addiction module toxin RelE n=1 Tax=Spirosoma montaniterrae TaxID=1178516 RepID=A0A1P9WU56_9BACT|nr:type II toxin-antitoxin system RelE/ParE family toxin [Spirosoma montaniterrae]AQG78863.1 addiction module toxin RelE [Spirosoma montaniterrae]